MDVPENRKLTGISVSIIVPFLNEEDNLEAAVMLIREALESSSQIGAFEIILVNDGSTDNSGTLAKRLSKRYDNILYLENEANEGIGSCYKKSLQVARYDYLTWLAADGSYIKEELRRYFDALGQGLVPISYSYGKEAIKTRSLLRRIISWLYRKFIYGVFGLSGVNYINGVALYKREFLKKIPLVSNGFGITAELVLRAARSNYAFQNVKMNSVERKKGKSKIFKLKNILDLARTLSILFCESYLGGDRKI